MEPNLEKLLADMASVRKATASMTSLEHSRAQNMARQALIKLHREDYDALLAQAKEVIISRRKPRVPRAAVWHDGAEQKLEYVEDKDNPANDHWRVVE